MSKEKVVRLLVSDIIVGVNDMEQEKKHMLLSPPTYGLFLIHLYKNICSSCFIFTVNK